MRGKLLIIILCLTVIFFQGCKKKGIKPNIPTQGLMAHYPLDGNAKDFSGNDLDGVVNNASPAPNRKGKIGRSLAFNGIDSNVTFGDVLDSQTTGNHPFSMSFWIYLNDINDPNARTQVIAPNNLLISKLGDSGCGENQRQFTVRLVDDKINGLFFYSLTNQTFRRWAGETLISPNTWYHIVFNYDPSIVENDGFNRLNIYINGSQEGLILDGSSGALGNIQNGAAHLGLGNRLDSNGDNCGTDLVFDGRIDDLRIYNRLLALEEIRILKKE